MFETKQLTFLYQHRMDDGVIDVGESSVQTSTTVVNNDEIWEIIDKEDDGKKLNVRGLGNTSLFGRHENVADLFKNVLSI